MKVSSRLYKSVAAAVCISLCVVLPFAFHMIPNGGTLFSPMHLPVLFCGIVCGPWYGLLCGLLGPLLSCILTGMPGAGYLPIMMTELSVYGLTGGLVMYLIHTGKQLTDIYISLLTAMLAGRILAGITQALLFTPGKYTLAIWATGYFVSCFPAILMQLILIPILYVALQKAGLLSHLSSRA